MGTITRSYTFQDGIVPTESEWNVDINQLFTLVNGQLDKANVDSSSSDGIMTLDEAQTVTGLKTYGDIIIGAIEDQSVAGGGVRTATRFRHDPVSGTVVDDDGIEILFEGDDDGGNQTTFGEIEVVFTDVSDGSEDARMDLKVMEGGTSTTALSFTTALIATPAATLSFDAAATIDTSGNNNLTLDPGTANVVVPNTSSVVIGHTAVLSFGSGIDPTLNVYGTALDDSAVAIARFQNAAGAAPRLVLASSRGASIGSYTVMQADDVLGEIIFFGADGSDLSAEGARIKCEVDGTPGSNDMPGRLGFWTTPDGGQFAQEAERIDNKKNHGFGGQTSFGTSAAGVLAIANGTAPGSSPANAVQLYAEDVSSSSELKVRDEAGNITTLSPHNFEFYTPAADDPLPWSYRSTNPFVGQEINVDISGAIRALETLTGRQFIYYRDVPVEAKKIWATEQAALVQARNAERARIEAANAERPGNEPAIDVPPVLVAKPIPAWIAERLRGG